MSSIIAQVLGPWLCLALVSERVLLDFVASPR